MKNFVQPGNVIEVPSAAAAVASGQVVIIGAHIGIANHGAAIGEPGDCRADEVLGRLNITWTLGYRMNPDGSPMLFNTGGLPDVSGNRLMYDKLYSYGARSFSIWDANGNLVTYKYDALNRLTDSFQHVVAGGLTSSARPAASRITFGPSDTAATAALHSLSAISAEEKAPICTLAGPPAAVGFEGAATGGGVGLAAGTGTGVEAGSIAAAGGPACTRDQAR